MPFLGTVWALAASSHGPAVGSERINPPPDRGGLGAGAPGASLATLRGGRRGETTVPARRMAVSRFGPCVGMKQRDSVTPVFQVRPEGKEGPLRTLHRQHLRPCPSGWKVVVPVTGDEHRGLVSALSGFQCFL